jgi:hypothetical protein
MPNISTTNINQTSFRGVIGDLLFPANYYDYFEIELWNSNGTVYYYNHNWIDSSGVNKYSYIDFSGLSSGTTYTIKGFVKPSGGTRTHVGTITVTTETAPPPPQEPGAVTNLSASPSTNGVYLSWSGASGATSYSAEIYVQGTSSNPVAASYSFNGTSTSLGGLSPNTAYTAKVYANNAVGSGTADFENFTTAPTTPTRPKNWEWTSLVSSRQTDPTVTYLGTIPLVLVNASEWNNFTKRINDFRTYKGLSTVSFSSTSSGNGFTDTIYNQAVNAISPMATVFQPSGFYSKLVALKNALNSIT